jgi:GNAT superfamily N-acetyltransferase
MSIEVRPLDAWDDSELASAHQVLADALRHDRPGAPVLSLDALRVTLVRPSHHQAAHGWSARLDGRFAGVLLVTWPVVDDVEACWVLLGVAPSARRNGVGSALHDALLRAVRLAGRSIVQVEVPHRGRTETWPGIEFARRRGYSLALREARHVLALPLPESRLAAEPRDGYVVHTWRDTCPAELLDAYCRLREAFTGEAPTGDLIIAEQHWGHDRVRDLEQRRRAQRRSAWTALAVSAEGAPAGFTELVAADDESDAHQNQTLVLPGHRGHGLGIALKVANVRCLATDRPDVEQVDTTVDPDNRPMNAVNAALGFEPVDMHDEWQLDLRDGRRRQ